MEGQKVHEYGVEAGPNGLPVARVTRVRNLITFVREGSQKLHYLDGQWVDDGKNPIDEKDVPEELKEQVKNIPFRSGYGSEADVLKNCEFCPDQMPSREYAEHLAAKHIRVLTSGKPTPASEPAVEEPVVEKDDEVPPPPPADAPKKPFGGRSSK